tara:strand:- start:3528 stop:3722 length:195 start_codon:yes stop_codon:yes gene_type:complete
MKKLSNTKTHRHLRNVVEELNPIYNFDNTESIFDLCLRMEHKDWLKLSAAIKYPNGLLREVGNE